MNDDNGNNDKTVSPTVNMDTDAKKLFWSNVLMQLTDSKRFLEFLDQNYTIGVHTDPETKTVSVMVVEKPTVTGPKLSPKQIYQISAACSAAGAKDIAKLLENLMKILGQENSSIIVPTEFGIDQNLLKAKLDE